MLGINLPSQAMSYKPFLSEVVPTSFISSWKTNNSGTSNSTSITIPTISTGVYDCYVTFGSADPVHITTYNDAAWTHDFGVAGTYTVEISGTFEGVRFANGGDRLKLINISQWGKDFRLGNVTVNFWGCSNLIITATDILNLEGETTLDGVFINCTSIIDIPNIGKWDVSNITSLSNTFNACSNFASDLSAWNVSNVTNMSTVFFATKINFSMASWNVSKVTSMANMFFRCTLFNQDLSSWNVSSVANMSGMFRECTAFQQNLGGWNIASLTNAANMFLGTTLTNSNYNGLLAGWAANSNRKNNVTFSGGNSHYDATSGGFNGTAGRLILTGTNSWTITDGGTP